MSGSDLSAVTSRMFASISNNIKIQRVRHGYTQERLAELLGISTQYLSQLERGESKPSLKLLVAASRCLGCPLYSLIPETLDTGSGGVEQAVAKLKSCNPTQLKIALEMIDWCLSRNTEE